MDKKPPRRVIGPGGTSTTAKTGRGERALRSVFCEILLENQSGETMSTPINRHTLLRKAGTLLLAWVLIGAFAVPAATPLRASAAEKTLYSRQEMADAAEGILDWCRQTAGRGAGEDLAGGLFAENAGTTDSDWFIIAMSQMGLKADYASYLSALSKNVQTRYSAAERLSSSKATEWHRITLAALACGGDPQKIGGADLIADGTYDRGLTKPLNNQGNNGTIFALIALDSKNYTAPSDAYQNRAEILQAILDAQLPGGGFAQLGTSGDVDVTAMALMALSPYKELYGEQIGKAVSFLSARQGANGGFSSGGVENTESTAQVIMALTALGIDPQKDSRFDKNGSTPVSRLMAMAVSGAGFRHIESGSEDWMASQQALCAIAALVRQMDGKGSLYRFGGGTPVLEAEASESNAGPEESGDGAGTALLPGVDGEEGPGSLPVSDGEIPESPSDGASQNPDVEAPAGSPGNGTVDRQAAAGRLALILLGLAGSGLCFWGGLKKATGRKKDILLLLAVILAVASLFFLAEPKSFERFRAEQLSGNASDTVTVRIDCSTVWANEADLDPALKDGGYIPADGIFLEETEVPFSEGETAFDVLMRIAAMEDLQIDYQGAESTIYGTAYVRGIEHLYEFSCGPLSGWTYSVNGEFPDRGSSGYLLKAGDQVAWIYTCDLGRYTDIGEAEETL
jgi:hypothetical protein